MGAVCVYCTSDKTVSNENELQTDHPLRKIEIEIPAVQEKPAPGAPEDTSVNTARPIAQQKISVNQAEEHKTSEEVRTFQTSQGDESPSPHPPGFGFKFEFDEDSDRDVVVGSVVKQEEVKINKSEQEKTDQEICQNAIDYLFVSHPDSEQVSEFESREGPSILSLPMHTESRSDNTSPIILLESRSESVTLPRGIEPVLLTAESNIDLHNNHNDPPVVAFPVPQSKRLLWYNLTKRPATMTVLRKLPYLFSGVDDDCNLIPWLFLDEDTLFICGGLRRQTFMPNTYEYKLSSTQLVAKADMIKPRICHGVIRVNDDIYAMTGYSHYQLTPTNEVYNLTTDTWTQLPNLPGEGIMQATVAQIKEHLFVAGQDCANVYKFSLENKEFETLKFTLSQPEENHKLFSWNDSLFILEHETVWKLSEDGEIQEKYDSTTNDPIHWLPGPPVYFEGKVYFAVSTLDDDHLYSFDFENPDNGVLLEE